MFHKITFLFFVLGAIFLGIYLTRFSQTDDLQNQYQRYGLISSEIHYQSVEKMWGEKGLIYYQIDFPSLKLPHHVNKMTFSIQKETTKISLSHFTLNVKEAMQKIYGSKLTEELEAYAPYSDVFYKFLTTLSLMGIDEFVGDIKVHMTYNDIKTMTFSIEMEQQKRPLLLVSGVIEVPVAGARHFSDLWQGTLESVNLKIQDSSLLQKYINYAQSRHVGFPEDLNQGHIKLKNLPKTLPKPNDILR